MAMGDEYRDYLFSDKLFEIPKQVIHAWLNNVEQAAVLDPQNSAPFMSKGICHFLLGDIDKAIKAEKKASRLAPKAVAIPDLGLAFLYNFQGQHKQSSDHYKLGLAKKTSHNEDTIAQCICFVTQCIEHFPNKKQLRLALALLKAHNGSTDSAKTLLRELLNDPPKESHLQGFVGQAKRFLKRQVSNKAIDSDKQ